MSLLFIYWWLTFSIIFLNKCDGTQLVDKAVFIAKTEYFLRQLTAVIWWDYNKNEVSEFLKNFNGSVITVNMDTLHYDDTVYSDQFVVFVTKSKEFSDVLMIIDRYVITSIQVILILTESENMDLEIPEITETAFINNITDIIILSNGDKNKVTLTTFFPISAEKCNNHFPVQLPDNTEVFFEEKFKNFHYCPIKVSLTNYVPYVILTYTNETVESVKGIHASFLKLVTKSLNATFIPKIGSNREGVGSEVNGSWTGSIGHLVKGDVDIVLPAEILNSDRYEAVQISTFFHTYLIVWCLPRRNTAQTKIEEYLANSDIVHYFCLSLIAFLIVTLLAQKFEIIVFKRQSNDHITFETCAIILGQPFKSAVKFWLINSLLIMWVWFCVVLRIVYQGEMIRSLYADDLGSFRTLDKALKYVDGYGGIDSILEFFKDTPMEKNFHLLSVSDVALYLEEISNGKKFLLASDVEVIWHYRSRIEILVDPVAFSPACFFVRARWSAVDEVNAILVKLVEAGIFDKMLDDHVDSELRKRDNTMVKQKEVGVNKSVEIIFFLMFGLWGSSIFVFILEIIYYKIKNMLNSCISFASA